MAATSVRVFITPNFQAIDWEAETSAAWCNGQKNLIFMYVDIWNLVAEKHCFGLKVVISERISFGGGGCSQTFLPTGYLRTHIATD